MRVFLLINGGRKGPPKSTVLNALGEVVELAGRGGKLSVSTTLDQARRLVDEAAEGGYDALWMGGGDGTINVLLNAAFGRGMALGVVPMGTVNALARSLGLPLDPLRAARRLRTAERMKVDAVQVTGRKFLCFASVGFDAEVVHKVGGDFKRQWGRAAYLAAGISGLLSFRKLPPFEVDFECTVEMNNLPLDLLGGFCDVHQRQQGYSLVVSNIDNYAGFRLFPSAGPEVAALETWLFRRNRPDDIAAWIGAGVAGELSAAARQWLGRNVGHYLTPGLTVRSEQRLFLQIDGEAVELPETDSGTCELHFDVLPKSVDLLVPRAEDRTVWD